MRKNITAMPRHKSFVASRGKQHLAHTVAPSYRSILFFLAAGMFLFSCEDKVKPSSETSLTSLTLTIESTDYAITFKDRQGTITLPYATKLPVTAKVTAVQHAAKATGVKVGDDVTIPASESFTLTVTAEDKTTTETYTVTVKKASASSEAAITDLTLTVGSMDYEIMFEGTQGTMMLPYSTEIPAKVGVKEIALSTGATSDAGNELSVTDNTVTITVTAEDKTTTETYTVTVKKAASASSEAAITDLTLTVGSMDYEIMFEGTQGTMMLPYSTEIPAKVGVKEIALSTGATSDAGNELSVTDNTVTITVTAEDKTTTETYTVTVKKAASASSEAAITDLTLTVGSMDYEIMFEGTQGTMMLPYSTEIPAKIGVKEIALSTGATSDAGNELSVTDNTVTITVTAEDKTTTQAYTVTLVVPQATAPLFTSFTFEVADNESMALDEDDRKRIVGIIDNDANTITFAQQSAYVYLNNLKATFTTSDGAAVQVGDMTQTSGVTEQDFSTSVSYVVIAEDTETATYTVTLAKSTMATIEDAEFRRRLQGFVPTAFTGDQLNIMHSAVSDYNTMDVNTVTFQNPRITSLKGIEFFTALDTLDCRTNKLTSLDLSKNTALIFLNCVFSNQSVGSLDLDVSRNAALKNLICNDNNITLLDLSGNTALISLSCKGNALTSLNLGRNTALTSLNCESNTLTSLNVSGNTALTTLNCSHNKLSSLNVGGNTALTNLDCGHNKLISLNVSGNTALTNLDCRRNSLTSLDMTGMRSVTGLNIGTGLKNLVPGTDILDNHLLATLRVNTAVQDDAAIITMKTSRGAGLTITTVNNNGEVVCNDYDPATDGGKCNQSP